MYEKINVDGAYVVFMPLLDGWMVFKKYGLCEAKAVVDTLFKREIEAQSFIERNSN
jgi:hypothetical protein